MRQQNRCRGQKVNTEIAGERQEVKDHSHLRAVVHPGAQLEVAGLVVEGEVHHVDWTRGPELGRRGPEHVARVLDYR